MTWTFIGKTITNVFVETPGFGDPAGIVWYKPKLQGERHLSRFQYPTEGCIKAHLNALLNKENRKISQWEEKIIKNWKER